MIKRKLSLLNIFYQFYSGTFTGDELNKNSGRNQWAAPVSDTLSHASLFLHPLCYAEGQEIDESGNGFSFS